MNKNTIREFFSGDVLRRGWFKRQYKLILLICILMFMYIYSGYRAQSQKRRLSDIQKELQDVHFEQLTINAQLAEQTRQSALTTKLKERGSNISANQEPAIRIQ